jgi:hypothetical protein
MYIYSTVDEYLHSFKGPKSAGFACPKALKNIEPIVVLIPLGLDEELVMESVSVSALVYNQCRGRRPALRLQRWRVSQCRGTSQ